MLQVLRDRQLQGWGDRRQQAQGGDGAGRGRHRQLQEGEPDHVRMGDQGPAAGGGHLQPGQRTFRLLHQQVTISCSTIKTAESAV